MSSVTETRPAARPLLVTGASGVVGAFLLPRLRSAGFDVLAVSRRPVAPEQDAAGPGDSGRVRWLTQDLADPAGQAVGPISHMVHAAPIWLLPPLVDRLVDEGLRRVVAFSSTSRFSKWDSASARERETARRLAQAEDAVQARCEAKGIAWTIFRPTLIYGAARDRNVSDIARLIRRFGVCPIAGDGRGRRQPVHADDLALACLAVLDNAGTFGRSYELPGAETLTYGEMIRRIAKALGRPVWTPRVPLRLLRAGLSVARLLPGFGHLTPEMADRMSEDLAFDGAAARRDFGYDPRPFGYDLPR